MKTNFQQSPAQPKARMRIWLRMVDGDSDGFITTISSCRGLISTIVKPSIRVKIWEARILRVGATLKSCSTQKARWRSALDGMVGHHTFWTGEVYYVLCRRIGLGFGLGLGKSQNSELKCQQHPAQPRDLGWQLGSGQGCSSLLIGSQELVLSPSGKADL